jgi:hypothetical protein
LINEIAAGEPGADQALRKAPQTRPSLREHFAKSADSTTVTPQRW